MDAEGPRFVAQVKQVQRLSLAQIEALAVEIASLGERKGKLGLLVVKRRAGRGQPTSRLIVMTEAAWQLLQRGSGEPLAPLG